MFCVFTVLLKTQQLHNGLTAAATIGVAAALLRLCFHVPSPPGTQHPGRVPHPTPAHVAHTAPPYTHRPSRPKAPRPKKAMHEHEEPQRKSTRIQHR